MGNTPLGAIEKFQSENFMITKPNIPLNAKTKHIIILKFLKKIQNIS